MSDMTIYDAIKAAGFAAPESIRWDGKLHRFATDAGKKHSKDGWYVAHDDSKGRAAAFGSWREGVTHTWSNGTGRQLTEEELAAIERQRQEREAEDRRQRERAAQRAQRLYDEALTDVTFSAYLDRKRIQCPDGVRAVQGVSSKAFGFDGAEWSLSGLAVPVRNRSGSMCSLQLIPDEQSRPKLFMKGGKMDGGFHVLGTIQGAGRILIGEGLATAQSAREATGCPAVVAFSAGNLPKVAAIIRSMNATADIIIIGDDDEAGRLKGQEAANKSRGRLVLPGSGCNDFNDLHVAHGLEAVRAAILGRPETVEPETPRIATGDSADWKSDLIIKYRDGGECVLCRIHNIALILDHADEFVGRVRFNEFSSQIAIDGVDMEDVGPVEIKTALEKNWIGEKVPTGDVLEGLSVVAKRHSFHPIRAYLGSLEWDGVERIPLFFSDFCGCPADDYHRATARSLFVSSVARIYKPGAKVDTMVILESAQGMRKTSLWPALYGEWSAEVTSSLNDKDFFSGLRGVWCADFGELDQFSKAETTRIKQVITQTFDHYRPHYGRKHQRFPRQCIFVGGTNQDNWQIDPTGARRFLPVRVRRMIDVETVAEIRDQLWAEAVARYERGETWWDIPDAAEHQEGSYAGDTWEEVVSAWLRDEYLKPQMHGEPFEFLLSRILTDAIGIDIGKQTRSDQTRAGNVMRRLGWYAKQEMRNGARLRLYKPLPPWIEAHEAMKKRTNAQP